MAEEIKLVGNFTDNITPKLRKLSKALDDVSKSFTKIQKKLRPITKEMGRLAMASERVANSLMDQKKAIDANSRSWSNYKKEVGQAAGAQRKAFKGVPRGGTAAPRVSRPTSSRGGGGGGAGMVAAGVIGEKMMDNNMGFGKTLLAMTGAGLAVNAMTGGFRSMTNAAERFIMAGSQAEQGVIQMAGTLQTLGKIGDFGKSKELAQGMMTELADIAAALPGATNDYLTILQQTLDDQITAFGSADKVTENLKEGERSFTALFGMSAQLAGLRPQIAAMDINQLRTNPTNMRNVQLLTRNPTLQKFYKEELEKTGGDFFMALKNAMEKAITPEQISALKRSFDSAYQTFLTGFTDPYSGVFGTMRQLEVSVNGVVKKGVTVMDQAGATMFALNEIFDRLWKLVSGGKFDPMVALFKALYSLEYMFGFIAGTIDRFVEDGLDFGEMVGEVGEIIGNILGTAANWVLNLDYDQFFKYVDEFIHNLFVGIARGFGESFKGGTSPFEAFGNSVSGTIASLIALKLAADGAATGLGFGKVADPITRRGLARAPGRARIAAGKVTGNIISSSGKQLKHFGGFLSSSSKSLKGFGSVLKGGIKSLGKFGGVMTAVVAAFDFIGNLISGKDFWESLAKTDGPVIGTILGAAIGGPIGAIIGGFLGDLIMQWQPAVDFMEGVFRGFAEVFKAVGGPVIDIFKQVFGIMGDLLGGLLDLIPGMDSVSEGFDVLAFTVNAVKIVLWPIVGLVQAIQMGLYALRLALVGVDLWLTKRFTPWRAKRIAKLEEQQASLSKEAAAAHKKNLEYYKPWTREVGKSTEALRQLQQESSKAGSTYENNQKYDIVVRCRTDLEFQNTLRLDDFESGIFFQNRDDFFR